MLMLHRGDRFDSNFYHQAGVDIDHAFFLKDGKRTLLVPKMNEAMARALFNGTVVAYDEEMDELLPRIRGRKVMFDALSLNAAQYSRLAKACRLEDCSRELLLARAKKKPAEVAAIREAVKRTKGIFAALDLKKARTELDVRKQLLVATAELGLEPAFQPIVATDESSAWPHHEPSARKLGSVVLVDYGVKFRHYRSDLTRCFIRGGDAGAKEKRAQYGKLQEVCHAIVDEVPDLRRGREVAAFAAKLMRRAGFPKLIHSIGHGVGLDIHELPGLGRNSDDPLAGTAFAIEPAFYLKRYGMRYEETVWFDGKKARIL